MRYRLTCPCDTVITEDESSFLTAVREHLATEHPGRDYPDEAIMLMASVVPSGRQA